MVLLFVLVHQPAFICIVHLLVVFLKLGETHRYAAPALGPSNKLHERTERAASPRTRSKSKRLSVMQVVR